MLNIRRCVMKYQGRVENGAVVFDTPDLLPEGAVVEVAVVDPPPPLEGTSFLDWVVALANSISDEDVEKMPADGSINHDHYLYGTVKREL
jgi:hypothetical protein